MTDILCTACGKVIQDDEGYSRVEGMFYHDACAIRLGLTADPKPPEVPDILRILEEQDADTEESEDEPAFGVVEVVAMEDESENAPTGPLEDDSECSGCDDTEDAVEVDYEGFEDVLKDDEPQEDLRKALEDERFDLYKGFWEDIYDGMGPEKVIEIYNTRKRQWVDHAEMLSERGMSKEEIESELESSVIQHRAMKAHMATHIEVYSRFTADDEGYIIPKESEPASGPEPEEVPKPKPEEVPEPVSVPPRRPTRSERRKAKKQEKRDKKAKKKADKKAKKQEKRDKKAKKKVDPDSFKAKRQRAKLRQKGYVDLITLSRNERTGEFIVSKDMVKKAELPREAVKVTGKRNLYCLDSIKRSAWYKETHDPERMYALTRNFSADDARLYMMSNKIDNALAVNWTPGMQTKDILKILMIAAAGIAIIGVFLLMRG